MQIKQLKSLTLVELLARLGSVALKQISSDSEDSVANDFSIATNQKVTNLRN